MMRKMFHPNIICGSGVSCSLAQGDTRDSCLLEALRLSKLLKQMKKDAVRTGEKETEYTMDRDYWPGIAFSDCKG